MDDLISRQAAIEVIDAVFPVDSMKSEYAQGIACGAALAKTYIEQLPSAQPEPAIPLSWIEGQIGWLKGLDNAFSTLTAGQILAMMNKWKDEQNG